MLRNIRCASLGLFVLASNAWSGSFNFDASAGTALVSNESYDEGVSLDGSFAYRKSDMLYRVGVLVIDELRPSGADEGTKIKTDGIYAGLGRAIDFGSTELELGIGALATRSEVYILGRQIGEKDDINPYLNIKIVQELTRLFSLQGDWKYVDDLVGGDIHLVQVGVRFSF
ncbi:MAG: hypothetical protein COA42_05135 [Alteromonadaceae bacterium]|nr:MAG: hypothetical protein COA42_05135 [Alteromonadaceae bacterium]